MYTTASYQYSLGKRDKLTRTSYLWAGETSIQDQHTLLDCSIFSTLLPVKALVQQNVDIICCQFCTFGTRTTSITSINKFCSLHTAITYLPPSPLIFRAKLPHCTQLRWGHVLETHQLKKLLMESSNCLRRLPILENQRWKLPEH